MTLFEAEIKPLTKANFAFSHSENLKWNILWITYLIFDTRITTVFLLLLPVSIIAFTDWALQPLHTILWVEYTYIYSNWFHSFRWIVYCSLLLVFLMFVLFSSSIFGWEIDPCIYTNVCLHSTYDSVTSISIILNTDSAKLSQLSCYVWLFLISCNFLSISS